MERKSATIIKKKYRDIMFQLLPIQIFFAIFWDLAIMSQYTDKSNILAIIIGSFIIFGSLLCSIIYLFYIKKDMFHMGFLFDNIKYLLPILIVFMLCVYTTCDSWLNLDGFQYYKELRKIRSFNFVDFKDLRLCGHMSQGYSLFLLLGEFITPGNIVGARIIHCIMAVITICCFYSIADTILVYSDKWDKALYTALFAFSPLFLCSISELNTDFPLLCFFVWMICCGFKEKYILQSFCGILLCFSKEPGCILYGSYMAGIVLCRIFKIRKEISFRALKKVLSPDLYLASLGGILWIITAIILNREVSGWVNNTHVSSSASGIQLHSVAIFKDYIIHRIKQMLFINFSYIFWGIILLFMGLSAFRICKFFFKKIKIKSEMLSGIVLSCFSFFMYSCLYVTYDHYRYLIPLAFFLFFGVMISMDCIWKNINSKKYCCAFFMILLLCSNFYTFDPLSKKVFISVGTGIGEILVPRSVSCDANGYAGMYDTETNYKCAFINNRCIYNFQSAYMNICFTKTMREIDYDADTLIILPRQYSDAWGTTASIFGINVCNYSEYYWDTKAAKLNINCADEIEKMQNDSRYCKFNYKVLRSMEELSEEETKSYQRIYYIALPLQENFNHEKFLAQTDSHLIDTVQYISWKWDVYQIK